MAFPTLSNSKNKSRDLWHVERRLLGMKGLEIISGNPPETHTHTVDQLDTAKHPV